jgi:hypothetical protein
VLQTWASASSPQAKRRVAAQAVAADLARLERADALKGQGAAAKATADRSAWAAWLARYAARLRTEAAAGADGAARAAAMRAVNPRYVLRNWCGLRHSRGLVCRRAGWAGAAPGPAGRVHNWREAAHARRRGCLAGGLLARLATCIRQQRHAAPAQHLAKTAAPGSTGRSPVRCGGRQDRAGGHRESGEGRLH